MKNGVSRIVIASVLSLAVGLAIGYRVDVTQLKVDVAVNKTNISAVQGDIAEIKDALNEINRKLSP